jgi:hypothetical protein
MWTFRATAAGSTVIFFSSIIKTAAFPSLSSVRVWGSASWRSALAITGAATIEAGLGMGEKTTGCIGRLRRAVRGLRLGQSRHHHRRGPIRRRDRIRHRGRGRRWIDLRRANRIFRATAAVLRNRRPSPRRARTTSRHRARTTSRHRIGRRPASPRGTPRAARRERHAGERFAAGNAVSFVSRFVFPVDRACGQGCTYLHGRQTNPAGEPWIVASSAF